MPAHPAAPRPENPCPSCGSTEVVYQGGIRARCKRCTRTFNRAEHNAAREKAPNVIPRAQQTFADPAELPSSKERKRHIYIPDTQIRKGVPVDHIAWIGEYVAEKGCDELIIAGDWWDMASLSMHDPLGSLPMEGARVEDDVATGNAALEALTKAVTRRGSKAAKARRTITLGNHEDRITRAVTRDPRYSGVLGLHHLNGERLGWKVYPFLQIVDIDGVWYSHYFANPLTGRPWGGTIDNRLAKIGHSFTQGHEQSFRYATRTLSRGQEQHGLVCGAAYLHTENYKGPQGNHHWRGIVVKNEVRNGSYDLMRVSLDYLCRRYEGVLLGDFMRKKYPREQNWFA